MRVLLTVVLGLHGLIHLMGAAKGFGWAELPQLKQPISPAMGAIWGVAALLFLAAAAGVMVWPRWWWALAAAGLVLSTVAIIASWGDAKAGAIANAVLAVAALAACFMVGPPSQRAAYERDARAALAAARPAKAGAVTDADLAALPEPVQRYLRAAGVEGQPRVQAFRVRMHGRIRSARDGPWMPLTADQVTTLDPPVRLFYLDARMRGLPALGYHRFAAGEATMLVKVLGLVPVARDGGAVMTRAETVTFLNDLCIFAPAALLTPAIRWDAVTDTTARATFTLGAHTVGATLVFGLDGRLADFHSDDRARAVTGGSAIEGQRWSTPVGGYRIFGPFTLMARGDARWHDADGNWPYIELDIDEIDYAPREP